MYTRIGSEIYGTLNGQPKLFAIAVNSITAEALTNDLNAPLQATQPQFKPWDIVKIKDEYKTLYSTSMGERFWLVCTNRDDANTGYTFVFDPELDDRTFFKPEYLELVERLSERCTA